MAPSPGSAFASFWMGGFEGADHVNDHGTALDMASANGHIAQLEDDHARAAALGIRTVRESIGWRLAETAPGRFALDRALRVATSARRHGLQVLWTLMHYGTPADVRLTDDAAIDRFASFAAAVARAIGPLSDMAPVFNPVNEISFLAWAVSQTDLIHPYRVGGDVAGDSMASGYAVKRRLVRMALAGIEAIRDVDPRARFLHVEPLVHVVPPAGRPDLADVAAQVAGYQWQTWDLLSGRVEPALGGTPEALDLIGVNHYHSSQWEALTEERLWWHRRDPRRERFGALLAACWERYGRPMIVAETSHFGEGRPQWLNEIAAEVARVRDDGLPVEGLCLYPLVDRPDWSDLAQWHDSGVWDVDHGTAALRRVVCPDYAAAIRRWQTRLPSLRQAAHPKPVLLVFSHLRWEFLFQRPQQLMTRLARDHRVLFIEEPLPLAPGGGTARIDTVSHGPDIDVLLPRTSLAEAGFDAAQAAVLAPLLAAELRRRGIGAWTAWLCTPLALPLATALGASRIVYDCMDEIAAFDGAPATMRAHEAELLQIADLVVASGPSLQRAKERASCRRVHCVANGVDAAAFAPASLDAGSAQARQARLRQPATGPRLGYCGAVDERIDLALLATLADAHPAWQIVMAGPVVKIDASTLPVRPNLHWIGHQPYARLPHLVGAWHVCLMPFVRSDVTLHMNPVKTLEFLAAGKPVVATPVPDVVTLHPHTVRFATTAAEFVAACEAALDEPAAARRARAAAAHATVRQASWDDRADRIAALLAAHSPTAAHGTAYRRVPPPRLPSHDEPFSETSTMSNSSILGGESVATRAAGRDADALGPSDTSDSGSDVQGERTMSTGADNPGELGALTVDLDSDSDAFGTGERGAAAGDGGRDGGDILPDQIIDADVDGDALVDAGFSDEIEDIEDDGDDEAGDDAPGARDAVSAEADASDAASRVFTLPPGTLESAEER